MGHARPPRGHAWRIARLVRTDRDIRVYADEAQQLELFAIRARQVIDFSATYDVFDAPTNTRLGAFRRKGLKSMLKDEWAILDLNDQEVGRIVEESTALALVRRFLVNLIPQTFHAELGGQLVASFRQHFNPFVQKITLDFTPDAQNRLDRRLGIAAAVLLCAIEGRQR
jgi:hypothetical protein